MNYLKDIPASVQNRIDRVFAQNRIPHCILLTGGSEKQRLAGALYFAAVLQCNRDKKPCGKCNACLKTAKGIHPDVTEIGAGGKSETIRLEDLKQLRQTCYILPNEGNARVYIIPQGGKMRTEGQNSLLKVIEEPPDHVYIIICSEVRSVLLPTILSRVYEIPVSSEIQTGSSSKIQTKNESVCVSVCTALAEKNEYALMTALSPLEKDRNAVSACAEKLILIIRDALTADECLSALPESAALLQKTFDTLTLMRMVQTAEEIRTAAARNANVNLMLSLFASTLYQDAIGKNK